MFHEASGIQGGKKSAADAASWYQRLRFGARKAGLSWGLTVIRYERSQKLRGLIFKRKLAHP
jgi:hypothetical protein